MSLELLRNFYQKMIQFKCQAFSLDTLEKYYKEFLEILKIFDSIKSKTEAKLLVKCSFQFIERIQDNIEYPHSPEQKWIKSAVTYISIFTKISNIPGMRENYITCILKEFFLEVTNQDTHNVVIKTLFKQFNVIFNDTLDESTFSFIKRKMILYKLRNLLCRSLDYEVQFYILKTLFRICPLDYITNQASKLFPKSPELAQSLSTIHYSNFHTDVRSLVNRINFKYNNIVSVKCESGLLGNTILTGPEVENEGILPLWVDFNIKIKNIAIFCNINCLITKLQSNNQKTENDVWQILSIDTNDVLNFEIERYYKPTEDEQMGSIIFLYLREDCDAKYNFSDKIAKPPILILKVPKCPALEELEKKVFPQLFMTQSQSPEPVNAKEQHQDQNGVSHPRTNIGIFEESCSSVSDAMSLKARMLEFDYPTVERAYKRKVSSVPRLRTVEEITMKHVLSKVHNHTVDPAQNEFLVSEKITDDTLNVSRNSSNSFGLTELLCDDDEYAADLSSIESDTSEYVSFSNNINLEQSTSKRASIGDFTDINLSACADDILPNGTIGSLVSRPLISTQPERVSISVFGDMLQDATKEELNNNASIGNFADINLSACADDILPDSTVIGSHVSKPLFSKQPVKVSVSVFQDMRQNLTNKVVNDNAYDLEQQLSDNSVISVSSTESTTQYDDDIFSVETQINALADDCNITSSHTPIDNGFEQSTVVNNSCTANEITVGSISNINNSTSYSPKKISHDAIDKSKDVSICSGNTKDLRHFSDTILGNISAVNVTNINCKVKYNIAVTDFVSNNDLHTHQTIKNTNHLQKQIEHGANCKSKDDLDSDLAIHNAHVTAQEHPTDTIMRNVTDLNPMVKCSIARITPNKINKQRHLTPEITSNEELYLITNDDPQTDHNTNHSQGEVDEPSATYKSKYDRVLLNEDVAMHSGNTTAHEYPSDTIRRNKSADLKVKYSVATSTPNKINKRREIIPDITLNKESPTLYNDLQTDQNIIKIANQDMAICSSNTTVHEHLSDTIRSNKSADHKIKYSIARSTSNKISKQKELISDITLNKESPTLYNDLQTDQKIIKIANQDIAMHSSNTTAHEHPSDTIKRNKSADLKVKYSVARSTPNKINKQRELISHVTLNKESPTLSLTSLVTSNNLQTNQNNVFDTTRSGITKQLVVNVQRLNVTEFLKSKVKYDISKKKNNVKNNIVKKWELTPEIFLNQEISKHDNLFKFKQLTVNLTRLPLDILNKVQSHSVPISSLHIPLSNESQTEPKLMASSSVSTLNHASIEENDLLNSKVVDEHNEEMDLKNKTTKPIVESEANFIKSITNNDIEYSDVYTAETIREQPHTEICEFEILHSNLHNSSLIKDSTLNESCIGKDMHSFEKNTLGSNIDNNEVLKIKNAPICRQQRKLFNPNDLSYIKKWEIIQSTDNEELQILKHKIPETNFRDTGAKFNIFPDREQSQGRRISKRKMAKFNYEDHCVECDTSCKNKQPEARTSKWKLAKTNFKDDSDVFLISSENEQQQVISLAIQDSSSSPKSTYQTQDDIFTSLHSKNLIHQDSTILKNSNGMKTPEPMLRDKCIKPRQSSTKPEKLSSKYLSCSTPGWNALLETIKVWGNSALSMHITKNQQRKLKGSKRKQISIKKRLYKSELHTSKDTARKGKLCKKLSTSLGNFSDKAASICDNISDNIHTLLTDQDHNGKEKEEPKGTLEKSQAAFDVNTNISNSSDRLPKTRDMAQILKNTSQKLNILSHVVMSPGGSIVSTTVPGSSKKTTSANESVQENFQPKEWLIMISLYECAGKLRGILNGLRDMQDNPDANFQRKYRFLKSTCENIENFLSTV